jgi:hypothetical protein
MSPSKDMEGVSDIFESAVPPAPARPEGGKRQKKIAVLTSGGDSAGMNAAGKLMRIHNLSKSLHARNNPDTQSEQSCAKVLRADARPTLFEKDGKVSSAETPPNPPPLLLP